MALKTTVLLQFANTDIAARDPRPQSELLSELGTDTSSDLIVTSLEFFPL